MTSPMFSRRNLLLGGLGVASTATLAACSGAPGGSGLPSRTLGTPTQVTPSPGQTLVTKTLVAKRTTLDLGGRNVSTWAYGDTVPGPLVRATAGDFLRLTLHNQLPADTTIHWHGIRLQNAADGVPGMTQDPVKPGKTFVYEFTAPDPGTYFFHPHVGVQLDRDKLRRYHQLFKELGSYPYDRDPGRPGWYPLVPNTRWADPALRLTPGLAPPGAGERA